MARMARFIGPGFVHHVEQHSSLDAPVFRSDGDYKKYLSLLAEHALEKGVSIWAYCILPHSIHLVVVPRDEEALSSMIRDVHAFYSAYYNLTYDHSGTLWRGRFQSCVVDDLLVMTAVRLVECHPAHLGLVDRAEKYEWSSAAAHSSREEHPFLEKSFPPPDMRDNWPSFLKESTQAEALEEQLQMYTRTGRPWGTLEFLLGLEKQYNRSLIPRKRGRKPKQKNNDDGVSVEDETEE